MLLLIMIIKITYVDDNDDLDYDYYYVIMMFFSLFTFHSVSIVTLINIIDNCMIFVTLIKINKITRGPKIGFSIIEKDL